LDIAIPKTEISGSILARKVEEDKRERALILWQNLAAKLKEENTNGGVKVGCHIRLKAKST